MNIAAAWTDPAVGEMCALDVSADWTVKDTVDNATLAVPLNPFGIIKTLNAAKTVCTLEVLNGYTKVRKLIASGVIAVGASYGVDGAAAQKVKTIAAAAGKPLVVQASAVDTDPIYALE